MKDIEIEVKKFRGSIVELVQAGSLPALQSFPRGCCNDSAYLLGTYLECRGFGTFEAVGAISSIEGNGVTHSWLEQNGLIIDITGSQFGKNNSEMYIGRNPEWLNDWAVHQRYKAQIFDDRLYLGNVYNEIIANINKNT